jgi:hypothetical protein
VWRRLRTDVPGLPTTERSKAKMSPVSEPVGDMLAPAMVMMRRRLSMIAALWIVLQIAGASAPLTLHGAGPEAICTCPSADHGATCPMHHPQGKAPAGDGHCQLRNGCAPADMALLSLAGGAGVPTPTTSIKPSTSSADSLSPLQTARLSRPAAPDAPPPRS